MRSPHRIAAEAFARRQQAVIAAIRQRGHIIIAAVPTGYECARCGQPLALDAMIKNPQTQLARLDMCRCRPGAPNRFEYRRPTIRELLERRKV